MAVSIEELVNLSGKNVILTTNDGNVRKGYILGTTSAIDNETDGKEMWSLDLKTSDLLYEF